MIASLIIGISLLYIPRTKEYIINSYTWILTGIHWLQNTQLTSYNYPAWMFLAISILILISILVLFLILKKSFKAQYTTYTEDFLYDAKWRWKWTKDEIINIECYCPKCDSLLVYDDSSCHTKYTEVVKTDFICENCNSKLVTSIHGGNKKYAINAVKREIQRRIRTEEYKTALDKN